MTNDQAIAYVEARVGPREETGIMPEEIEAMIPAALARYQEEVSESEHASDLSRTDALPLDGAGVAIIPSDILPGSISRVAHADAAEEFTRYFTREDLTYHFCTDIGAAAIVEGKIYTLAPDEVPSPLTGNLSVTGQFTPVIGSIPAKKFHEQLFIDELVKLVHERMKLNPVGREKLKQLQAA